MSYEWPLLIFTFLAEVAVGAFIGGGCLKAMGLKLPAKVAAKEASGESGAERSASDASAVGTASNQGVAEAETSSSATKSNAHVSDKGIASFAAYFGCCAGILAIGLVASMLHLGYIGGAPSALFNVGESWLSREILTGILTLIGMAVTAVLAWKVSENASTIAWVVSVIIALVFMVSAGNAYQLSTIPYWNTIASPLMLIVGALLSGAAVTTAFALMVLKVDVAALFPFVGFETLMLSVLGFVLAIQFGESCIQGTAGVASVVLASGDQMFLVVGQVICGVVGAGLQIAAMWPSIVPGKQRDGAACGWLFVIGCVLILVTLFMARMLFYSCAINLQY